MPDIPAQSFGSNTLLTAAGVYDTAGMGGGATGGVWKPGIAPTTFEVMLGGMTNPNYAGGNDSIKPCHCIPGAFMRAFYLPFDDWNITYACQAGEDANHGADEVNRVYVAGLCGSYFLPWTARFIWYGWQAFFRQDATEWANGAYPGNPMEYWDLRTRIGSVTPQELYARLPHGRSTNAAGGTAGTGVGHHREECWRYVSKLAIADTSPAIDPGQHLIRVSTWAGVIGPDPEKAKVVIPTGGLWAVAFK